MVHNPHSNRKEQQEEGDDYSCNGTAAAVFAIRRCGRRRGCVRVLVDVLEVLVTEDAVVVAVVVSWEQSPPVYPKTQLHPQLPVVPLTVPSFSQVMSSASHASAVPQLDPE